MNKWPAERGEQKRKEREILYERTNQATDQSIPPENRAKTLLEIYFLEAEPGLREVA